MRNTPILLLVSAFVAASAERSPQLRWEGYVRDGAVLYIQEDRVDVQGRATGSVEKPRVSLFQPLPATQQAVQMNVVQGKGRVNVVEQPNKQNDYTAVVRIDPVQEQHEFYRIDFFWVSASAQSKTEATASAQPVSQTAPPAVKPAGGELIWSGTVDEEAVIRVRGEKANARVLRGRPVSEASAIFTAALPQLAKNLRLEKISGRGQMELLEQPTSANNYAASVRIHDEAGGADRYSFRLVWDVDETAGLR